MTPLVIDPYLLALLIAALYLLVFGGLSWVRREGLSGQFALEGLAIAALVVGLSWWAQRPPNPLLLLVLLYLVTMRCRLIVDLANLMARRGRYPQAFGLYALSLRLWPDAASRLAALTNRGAAELHSGQVQVATATLEDALAPHHRPRLGVKYEAAARFNLGLAYETSGQWPRAVHQYNQAIDLLPGSPYARAAQARMERHKKG
jgi:tetratricopeptide (TPR) repeat protein